MDDLIIKRNIEVIRVENPHTGTGLFGWDGNGRTFNLPTIDKVILDSYSRHNNMVTLASYYNVLNGSIKLRKNIKRMRHLYCAYKSMDHTQIYLSTEDMIKLIRVGYKIFKIKLKKAYEVPDQIFFTKRSIIEKQDISGQILKGVL